MLFCVLFFFFLVTLSFNLFLFFFFNDTATTEIYTLSLHDALPISHHERDRTRGREWRRARFHSPLRPAGRWGGAREQHDTPAAARHGWGRRGPHSSRARAASGGRAAEPARQGARARRATLLPSYRRGRVRSGGPGPPHRRAGAVHRGGREDVRPRSPRHRGGGGLERGEHRGESAPAAPGARPRSGALEPHGPLRARSTSRSHRHVRVHRGRACGLDGTAGAGRASCRSAATSGGGRDAALGAGWACGNRRRSRRGAAVAVADGGGTTSGAGDAYREGGLSMALDPDQDEEQARAAAEGAARLRQRGIALTGAQRPDDLADLLSAVERFQAVVEAHGGDLMVYDLKSSPSDDSHFVVPRRGHGETVRAYGVRIDEAAARLRGHPRKPD